MRIAFVHDLPVGGAKRSFHSLLPYVANNFDLKVVEFEREDSGILKIGDGNYSNTITFKSNARKNRFIYKIPLVGVILKIINIRSGYKKLGKYVNNNFDLAIVTHCRFLHTPALLDMLTIKSIYFCHEPPRSVYEFQDIRSYTSTGFVQKINRALTGMIQQYWDKKCVKKADYLIANS